MAANSASPWVMIRQPVTGGAPLVFDSPHSGIAYPDDFHPAASRAAVRSSWDAYVDELFSGAPAAGATLIAANFPRAYIDANRAGNDIDPSLLESPWPAATELSEHAGRGMGLIRRLALPGIPMYDRKLTVAEVRDRIERYYLPYRRALQEATDAAVARHGFVWHFNCHSMKSRGNAMNRDAGALRADFVLGDREGTSAPREFTAWVAEWFTANGHRVAINQPYRGADIVRALGTPARGRYSLQIEVNRGLYLDEATCERSAGFSALREELTRFSLAVAEFARKCPTRPLPG